MDDKLRQQVRAVFEEIDNNAAPMRELSIKAIKEDWDEERLKQETINLIKNNMLDTRKNYDYYTDKIVSIFKESNER